MWQKKKLKNEKGLTLVELLAVIVILAVIMIIASTSISQIIKNARADTHLENAKNILDVGKMAYVAGEEPEYEFGEQPAYRLSQLAQAGYLSDTIKSPSYFDWWEDKTPTYDLESSLVVIDKRFNPPLFRVNLNAGGGNFIFDHPLPHEGKDITRENLTDEFKKQLGIK